MIDKTLGFLRDQLNGFFNSSGIKGPDTSLPDLVTFPEADKPGDALGFTMGHVSLVLINLMEDTSLRPGNPYAGPLVNGTRLQVQPEIRLNLSVLFVAHFSQYDMALARLSDVVGYFQNHRVFTPANSPNLPATFDQLVVELMTVPFSELNEIWGALRTNYRPSVLYRVRMVVFRDSEASLTPQTSEVAVHVSRSN